MLRCMESDVYLGHIKQLTHISICTHGSVVAYLMKHKAILTNLIHSLSHSVRKEEHYNYLLLKLTLAKAKVKF